MAEDFSEEQAKTVDGLLLAAVRSSDIAGARLCLQKGADIDARDDAGRTPLITAVWYGYPEMAEFLLGRAPAMFLKDSQQKNVFDYAAQVQQSALRQKFTEMLLRALPDHIRKRNLGPAAAARLAEAESLQAQEPSPAITSDITVSKPLSLPSRHKSGKGFSL